MHYDITLEYPTSPVFKLPFSEAQKEVVEDAELDELNRQLADQTETLMAIQERFSIETSGREHAEQKIQEMRREKEQLQQIIQENKDTAEAFQV